MRAPRERRCCSALFSATDLPLFLVERPTFVKTLAEKSRAGCSVRLLFGGPSSREVIRRSEEEQLGKHTLGARIRNALAFYRPRFEMEGPEFYQ